MKESDLEPHLGEFEFYLEAFKELSSCRSVGMALGPIPFTAVVEYVRYYEIEDVDFHYLIRRLDDHYLLLQSKKNEPKEKKVNATGSANPPDHRKDGLKG